MPRPHRTENQAWPPGHGASNLHILQGEESCVHSVFEQYHQDFRQLLDDKLDEVLAHNIRIERSLEELRGAQRTRRCVSSERTSLEESKCGCTHCGWNDSSHGHPERSLLEQKHKQYKKNRTLEHVGSPLHEGERCMGWKPGTGDAQADGQKPDTASSPGVTHAATPEVVKACSEGDEKSGLRGDPQGTTTMTYVESTASTHPMSQWIRTTSSRNFSRVQSVMNSKGAGCARQITTMFLYKRFVPASIILNAAFIGLTVQWQAKTGENPAFEGLVELIFSIIFATELGIRLCAEGCSFFSSEDRSWNWFDFFIVSIGLVERLLVFLEGRSGWLSDVAVLRIVRVVRIMRVLRIIRTLKFFRDLRIMVQCILASIKSLTWVLCVLAIMFYVFGVALTQGANDFFADIREAETPPGDLEKHFGSLDKSMMSLFQAMSGGVDWGELVQALSPLPWFYTIIFLCFIAGSIYAVSNVVTGVFVENAVQSGQNDRDSLVEEELRAKKKYAKLALDFFKELDFDGSGTVSYEELELACEDESVVAYFGALQLDIKDVKTLFSLMDQGRSGGINIEEFITGLLRLKGEARSIDIAKLQYEVEQIANQINNITGMLNPLLIGRSLNQLGGKC